MIGKFNHIINSNKPVLVDFFAEWCGPCKQMPAILKEVKSELKDQVRIIKVDVDRNPMIASKYKIKSIPTLIIFQDGEVKWQGMGVHSAQQIKGLVENIIKN